jgi:predicted AlkP superfamily phosphohydrolase/phosphomutase
MNHGARGRRARIRRRYAVALVLVALIAGAPAAHAYVGPGAGFALLSSFFVLFTTIVVVLLSVLSWPARALWRAATGRVAPNTPIGRLVIVGFDGQDPTLTDQFLAEGRLPNFQTLASTGAYRRLKTTFPSVSPVAWSSFSTGCEPARHNIFDFIEPDRRTYLPLLSSARVGPVGRVLKLGRFQIPLGQPDLRLLRRSKPFWSILGEHRIWSTILRVPVTFPPDRFYGAELSAMGVPDLLGTQGTFLLFTTRPLPTGADAEGGLRLSLPSGTDTIHTAIPGPNNPYREGAPPMLLPLHLTVDRPRQHVQVTIAETTVDLALGQLSDWIVLPFRAAPTVTVRGLSRLMLTECGDHLSLYLSPINLDPERPAMPISHPSYYATYLAKRLGPFATLGLAEDTSALNDGVTDDGTFLRQTWDIDAEREAMLFAGLDRLKRGTIVCVFDATDRVQHMFWRDIDPRHPAGQGRAAAPHRHAIRQQYERNDALLGRLFDELRDDDVLMVISDHGFTSFRRGINLNSWLLREGYLTLKPGASGRAQWLRDVDWSQTRAYCLGLTGLFLNLEGREGQGIVARRDSGGLIAEIQHKLNGLLDPDTGEVGIREAFVPATLYAGPYLENAPDLLIGYNAGYRTSWDCAQGVVAGPVFQDNARPWSGDHCVDPRLVPGVFFCNRPTTTEQPALIDLAPTALRLFGVEPPAYMDGRPLAGLG